MELQEGRPTSVEEGTPDLGRGPLGPPATPETGKIGVRDRE